MDQERKVLRTVEETTTVDKKSIDSEKIENMIGKSLERERTEKELQSPEPRTRLDAADIDQEDVKILNFPNPPSFI
ncbi:unnamed protein product [Caenorhabditis nigoni]